MAFGVAHVAISIHALCEEGDPCWPEWCSRRPISIHALCEEGDTKAAVLSPPCAVFLSTPSARRATRLCDDAVVAVRFLSTPSARRATSAVQEFITPTHHSAPRPLRGGRVPQQLPRIRADLISIHALCEEGDESYV